MLSHVEPIMSFLPRSLVRYEFCCFCMNEHHVFAIKDFNLLSHERPFGLSYYRSSADIFKNEHF